MPSGLHRIYGAHHLHFVTRSCYRRLPFLNRASSRDRFVSISEQVRQRYRFVVVGYVVMPERAAIELPHSSHSRLEWATRPVQRTTCRGRTHPKLSVLTIAYVAGRGSHTRASFCSTIRLKAEMVVVMIDRRRADISW
jgi:hypothetical protein